MNMNRRLFLFLFFLFSFLFLLPSPVGAAKKRIRAPRVAGVSYSGARLSRGTNSVVVTFLHLDKTKRVDYILNYTANGIGQGVVGSLTPTGQISDLRDLYFGTCSKGVCTPHYNIQGATLTITTTLTSGATYIKRYRLRV